MKWKWLIFIILIGAVLANIVYSNREIFFRYDTLKLSNTRDNVKTQLKVYAVVGKPDHVTIDNGELFTDGPSKAFVLFDGNKFYKLPKQYYEAKIFLICANQFFLDINLLHKSSTSDVFTIILQIDQKDSSYYVSGRIESFESGFTHFENWKLRQFSGNARITYPKYVESSEQDSVLKPKAIIDIK
jgi:hypothetical protein